MMKTWRAKIKEKGNGHILTPEYSFFNAGEKTRQDMIDFWGLENYDVEWYELELVDDDDNND